MCQVKCSCSPDEKLTPHLVTTPTYRNQSDYQEQNKRTQPKSAKLSPQRISHRASHSIPPFCLPRRRSVQRSTSTRIHRHCRRSITISNRFSATIRFAIADSALPDLRPQTACSRNPPATNCTTRTHSHY